MRGTIGLSALLLVGAAACSGFSDTMPPEAAGTDTGPDVEGAAGVPSEPPRSGVIQTVAGTGEEGTGPTGLRGRDTALAFPSGVGIDDAGELLIADFKNHRVLRLGSDGRVQGVAGSGVRGYAGDGGDAGHAQLNFPCGVTGDGSGGILVVDTNNHAVRRVGPEGTIHTLVDGLLFPEGVAPDGDGGIYIAEAGHYAVGHWSPDDGLVTVLDEGLISPYDVALHPDGRLLVADFGGHLVMAVLPDGSTAVVAGTGTKGFAGDGGRAEMAQLAGPQGVAVGRRGDIYIADTGNHRVRRVGLDGHIRTVAGTGVAGFGGDGQEATQAQLAGPTQVAVDAGGRLVIADSENHRIRRVDLLPVIEPFPATYHVVEASGIFQGQESTTGPDGVVLPDGTHLALEGVVSFTPGRRFEADLVILEDGEPHWLSEGGFTRFEGPFAIDGTTITLDIPLWGVQKALIWQWSAEERSLSLTDVTPEGAIPLIHGDIHRMLLTQVEGDTP